MRSKQHITIRAFFRAADIMRDILRDYAVSRGYRLTCYTDLWNGISRMPANQPHEQGITVVVARPERFLPEGMAVLDDWLDDGHLFFILWHESEPSSSLLRSYMRQQNLYIAESICQLDAVLKEIEATITSPHHERGNLGALRHLPRFQPVSLSDDELDALRGAAI
jgi:hypothetical protein